MRGGRSRGVKPPREKEQWVSRGKEGRTIRAQVKKGACVEVLQQVR